MGNIDANIYEPIQGFTGVFGLTAWYDSLTPWTGVEDVTQPRPRLWLPGYVLQTYDLADCEAVRLVLVEGTETVTVALDITRVYDPARKVPGVGLFPYWHPAQGREAPGVADPGRVRYIGVGCINRDMARRVAATVQPGGGSTIAPGYSIAWSIPVLRLDTLIGSRPAP